MNNQIENESTFRFLSQKINDNELQGLNKIISFNLENS